jgi:hypothetical protein
MPVPKTALGLTVGSKFDDFERDSRLGKIKLQGLDVGDLLDQGGGIPLFRPTDMFQIEKPGTYTLRIRFQFFAFPQDRYNPGRFLEYVLKFPDLEYTVIKENVNGAP